MQITIAQVYYGKRYIQMLPAKAHDRHNGKWVGFGSLNGQPVHVYKNHGILSYQIAEVK